ncbi:dTDP-4-dehydrorhamnose 3,5-epimerase [Adhaeribacter terreus]|uniref:dTDP-4-dehydrorhamnose 3,5-epimerase n=1 Tax=Adhaeribacter terreus TaxID=529703 RepID=A0ABW0EBC1_9BACT
MEYKEHHLKGVIEYTPKKFGDERGWFMESYNRQALEKLGVNVAFVQDNQSFSVKNVLRGLHFQKPPFAQAKLVRVLSGKALDVVVDIRKGSPTYGQHLKVVLDAEQSNQLFIPAGFAHGFLTLEDNTTFFYKCSDYYNKESEGGLLWNDPALNIDWNVTDPIVSEKDQVLPGLEGFISAF